MSSVSVEQAVPSFTISQGILRATPIVLCYLPVAFALGVVAGQLQFSILETILFFSSSLSGSGQSIALQMLRADQPLMTIWPITIIINLRYFLMSSALAPHLSSWPKWLRYFFSLFVTDEIFALHANQFRTVVPPPAYVFAVNLTPLVAWTLGGVMGQVAGAFVADVKPFGFDFAVPGMFIALVVMQVENRRMLGLGILGAALGLLFTLSPLKSWSVLLSSIICATLGTVMEKWKTE